MFVILQAPKRVGLMEKGQQFLLKKQFLTPSCSRLLLTGLNDHTIQSPWRLVHRTQSMKHKAVHNTKSMTHIYKVYVSHSSIPPVITFLSSTTDIYVPLWKPTSKCLTLIKHKRSFIPNRQLSHLKLCICHIFRILKSWLNPTVKQMFIVFCAIDFV